MAVWVNLFKLRKHSAPTLPCMVATKETKMAPISFWPLGGSQDAGVDGRGQVPPLFQVPVLLLSA